MKWTAPLALLAASLVAQAEDAAQAVFRKASPSVLSVVSLDARGQPDGEGSAVAVAADLAVTNCHVVENARSLSVTTAANRTLSARPVRKHAAQDLCLIQVQGGGLEPALRRSGGEVGTGERVYAVGNPLGLGLSISSGLVSGAAALHERRRLLVSAPISPGSSGGGLFDAEGRLVGITTATLTFGQAVNLAVPADEIDLLVQRGAPMALRADPVADPDWDAEARALEGKADWTALLRLAERWTEAQPTSAKAADVLGNATFELKFYPRAKEVLAAAVARHPRDAPLWTRLAWALWALGERDAAQLAARKAIEVQPSFGPAYVILGRLLKDAKQLAAAALSAERARHLSPGDGRSWAFSGDVAAEQGAYDDAARFYRIALRQQPKLGEVERNLAFVLTRAGRLDEAGTLLRRQEGAEPRDAKAWSALGVRHLQARQFGEAEQAFRRAIELDARSHEAWAGLGAVQRRTGRDADGEEALRTALRYDPSFSPALRDLAEALGRRGEPAEAIRLAERATAAAPRNVAGWRLLLLLRRGDWVAMEAPAERVVALEGDKAIDWVALGEVKGKLGKWDDMFAAFKKAESISPDESGVLLGLAWYHHTAGDLDRALGYTERAVRKAPDSAAAWSSRGYALLKAGRRDEAMQALRTSVQLNPNNPDALTNLGEALLADGQLGASIRALQAALKQEPRSLTGRLLLVQAYAFSDQFDLAKEEVVKLLQTAPSEPIAWYSAGALAVLSGDQETTDQAFARMRELNPATADHFNSWVAALGTRARAKPQ